MNQFSDAAYFREMSKPLFAAFPSCDTFSQHFSGEVAANFPAVLEAVSNCLRRAVDTNRHANNPRIDDSLCEGGARESDEAQSRTVHDRLSRFTVDGHPNRTGAFRKNAVEPERGFEAYNTVGDALAGKQHLTLEVRG